jgi:hypothetical protein
MAEEKNTVKLDRAKKFYRACPRCSGEIHFLTNSAGDVVVMCAKRTCHFAVIDEGQFTFISSG